MSSTPIAASRGIASARLMHTMLRVADLERSLHFYTGILGMRLMRREEYPDGRFTLAFVGFGTEASQAVLELTHNWDIDQYEAGSAFGHVALEVGDLQVACDALRRVGVTFLREPGPMRDAPTDGERDTIAFIADPDGFRIELVEARHPSAVSASPKSTSPMPTDGRAPSGPVSGEADPPASPRHHASPRAG